MLRRFGCLPKYTTPFSGVLHIVGVQASDAGTYRCLASNTVLSKDRRSSSVTVTVLEAGEEDVFRAPSFLSPKKHLREIELDIMVPPEIISPPEALDTLLAKTARLDCMVVGNPPPRVTWYKDGLTVNTKGRIIQTSANQLVFTNSITSDTGLYQCLAHNDAGYASSWAPMVINSSKNHPDPPQNLHYVVLSSTSVLLTWDAVLPTSELYEVSQSRRIVDPCSRHATVSTASAASKQGSGGWHPSPKDVLYICPLSLINYAAPVLIQFSDTQLRSLELVQNEAMMIILGCSRLHYLRSSELNCTCRVLCAALYALRSISPMDCDLVNKCLDLIHAQEGAGTTVHFTCIPSHVDIPLNEKTDRLAQCALHDDSGPWD
ncbi:Protogenin B [Portunus trituberculatus]|uniref:Protogenin B n=1 Tax=Portunus trituberculatus TaxID=210409 RepID=A0A5B7DZD5_PORTR|nr:Protogenin B [Portunus trituberculatus]